MTIEPLTYWMILKKNKKNHLLEYRGLKAVARLRAVPPFELPELCTGEGLCLQLIMLCGEHKRETSDRSAN